MKRIRRAPQAGFSLLEVIIAVSVLAILAGVISLRSGAVLNSARATKVVQIASNLKTACASHQADTGTLPREYAGYGASNRQLSGQQTTTGWNGPYIESPLGSTGTNPYGGTIHLYNYVTANGWITGFDTDGDGTVDVTGTANMLMVDSVEEDEAKRINDLLDAGLPGTWTDSGRVRYISGSKRILILVYH